MAIRVTLTSIMVNDQARARDFYTRVLGFVIRHDIAMGDVAWLTVVPPSDSEGVEILLEPMAHRAAAPFQQALYADGIPLTMLGVDDIQAEYDRLSGLGVQFTGPPVQAGPVTIAVFDDTCGNYIQLAQAQTA